MPLQLGGAESARSQLLVYDPTVAAEAAEAADRRHQLLKEGFRIRDEEPGKVTLDPPPLPAHKFVFRILSKNGDDRIVWDRTDPDQVREAKQKFDALIKEGYTAYAVRADGKPGHKITEFNPGLQEIFLNKEVVFVPRTMPG